jgi:hypothetical protein
MDSVEKEAVVKRSTAEQVKLLVKRRLKQTAVIRKIYQLEVL